MKGLIINFLQIYISYLIFAQIFLTCDTMGKWYDSMGCNENNSITLPPFIIPGLLRTDTENIVVKYVLPVFATIGAMINGSFLIVLLKSPRLKNRTNAYLGNLAVSDMIYLIFNTPFEVARVVLSPFATDVAYLRTPGCVITEFVHYLSFYASMILITVVSFERYLAVCHPIRHKRVDCNRRTIRLITVSWIFAVLLSIPMAIAESNYLFGCFNWYPPFSHFPKVIGQCHSLFRNVTKHLRFYLEFGTFVVCLVGEYTNTKPIFFPLGILLW